MRARLATPADASAIAGIYNQAIEDRTATFETDFRTDEDVIAWFDGAHPVVVVIDEGMDEIIAFARTSEHSSRKCYEGIFEFGVYTDHNHRRRGAASTAMRELITRARSAGAWKLVSRVFIENEASRAMLTDLGFREVGVYHRHAKLDGHWRDVVIVEKFLAPVVVEASVGSSLSRASREQILTSLRSDDLKTRVLALGHARVMLDAHQFPDPELLEAASDALFLVKVHDTTARSRFVDLFRTYASLSTEATQDLYEALFTRLDRLSIALDLDAFYEATFVVKQIASAPNGPAGVVGADLTMHVPRLLDWMKLAIDLPAGMRTRISPGNVTSLLMNLALSGSATEEERQSIAELAAEAKARHRVEPPVSIRSSVPPPPMTDIPPIPAIPGLPTLVPDNNVVGAATIEVAVADISEIEAHTATTTPPPPDDDSSELLDDLDAVTVEVTAIDVAAIEAAAIRAERESEKELAAVVANAVAPIAPKKKRAAPKATKPTKPKKVAVSGKGLEGPPAPKKKAVSRSRKSKSG